MSAYYIFARCWVGFDPEADFPFDKFNDLPDDKILPALETYCVKRGDQDQETSKAELIARCKQVIKTLRQRATQTLERPPNACREITEALRLIYAYDRSDAHGLRDATDSETPLEDRSFMEVVAAYIQLVHSQQQATDDVEITESSPGCQIAFALRWTKWLLPRFGRLSPSRRLLMDCVETENEARRFVELLQGWRRTAPKIVEQWYVGLRFGYAPVGPGEVPTFVGFPQFRRDVLASESEHDEDRIHRALFTLLGPFLEEIKAPLSRAGKADEIPAARVGSRRKHKPDAGGKLKAKARKEMVLEFVRECRWSGTLDELREALLREKGLPVTKTTLWRDLEGTKYVGSPRRAAKGKGEREAVTDDGAEDMSDLEAWTMPDDVS